MNSKITKLLTISSLIAITLLPQTAHAAALFDSGTNFLGALQDLLTNTWARILAIIAVVFLGFAWMFGRISWQLAASVIGGIILIFGAPAIVDSIAGSIQMSEEDNSCDPLFIGMTRPPMMMGVPMEFFGFNFIILGIGMILFMSLSGKILFFILINLPLHAAAYVATERDTHWMRVWLTKLRRCSPIRNKGFWKSNSYKP